MTGRQVETATPYGDFSAVAALFDGTVYAWPRDGGAWVELAPIPGSRRDVERQSDRRDIIVQWMIEFEVEWEIRSDGLTREELAAELDARIEVGTR